MIRPSGIQALDWLLNTAVVSPVMICYWCGIFELYDYYLNPAEAEDDGDGHGPLRNAVTVTLIGSCFYLAYFVYPSAAGLIRRLRHPTLRHNLVSLVLMVGGIFHMGYWKGVWMLAELALRGADWHQEAALLLAGLLVKIGTGSLNALLFPPFAFHPDSGPRDLSTRDLFGQEYPGLRAKPLILYLLGTATTMFLGHSCTVLCWASALFLVARLDLDWFGLQCTLGLSTLATVLVFLLETPLARLRARLLADGESYSFRATADKSDRRVAVRIEKAVGDSIDSEVVAAATAAGAAGAAAAAAAGRGGRRGGGRGEEEEEEERGSPCGSSSACGRRRLRQLLLDDAIILALFCLEAFFFGSFWDLFAGTFLSADRRFGAWMLTTVGATLVVLSGSCSLFGGIGSRNDIHHIGHKREKQEEEEEAEEGEDDGEDEETETERAELGREENYLFCNRYARHYAR